MTNSDNDILILFRTNEPQSMIAIGKGLKDKITEGQTYGILFKNAAGDQNCHCRNRAARNTFTATAILLYTEAGKKVSDTLKIEDQKIRCNELAPSENSSETQAYTFADGNNFRPEPEKINSIFVVDDFGQFFAAWFWATIVIYLFLFLYRLKNGKSNCEIE